MSRKYLLLETSDNEWSFIHVTDPAETIGMTFPTVFTNMILSRHISYTDFLIFYFLAVVILNLLSRT